MFENFGDISCTDTAFSGFHGSEFLDFDFDINGKMIVTKSNGKNMYFNTKRFSFNSSHNKNNLSEFKRKGYFILSEVKYSLVSSSIRLDSLAFCKALLCTHLLPSVLFSKSGAVFSYCFISAML